MRHLVQFVDDDGVRVRAVQAVRPAVQRLDLAVRRFVDDGPLEHLDAQRLQILALRHVAHRAEDVLGLAAGGRRDHDPRAVLAFPQEDIQPDAAVSVDFPNFRATSR